MIKNNYLIIIAVAAIAVKFIFNAIPDGFNYTLIQGCLLVFYALFFIRAAKKHFIYNKISTEVRIDLLFMVFYYVIFLHPYQAEIIGFGDITYNKFISNIFMENSNRAVFSATVGAIFFVVGFFAAEKFFKNQSIIVIYNLNYGEFLLKFSVLMLIVLIIIFYASGASSVVNGAYTGVSSGSSANDGIYFLVSHFAMLTIAFSVPVWMFNIRSRIFVLFALCIASWWSLLVLGSGDRNTFMLIAMIGFAGYVTYIKKVSIIVLVISAFMAYSLYQIVEITRQTDQRDIGGVIKVLASETDNSTDKLDESSFSLTTITLRAIFSDNYEGDAKFFGRFKIIGAMGVVPFSRQLISKPDDNYYTSAEYITEIVLGNDPGWSIGSNIISDIIADFGIMGVVGVMYLIGFYGGYAKEFAAHSISSESVAIYLMMLSLYFEYPRYAVDFPVRNIAWTLLFMWISRIIFEKFFSRRF